MSVPALGGTDFVGADLDRSCLAEENVRVTVVGYLSPQLHAPIRNLQVSLVDASIINQVTWAMLKGVRHW
jgi:hypothetical protein